MSAIITNIEKIRKEIGLTQVQLAELLKVQQSTISHIENGERNPSVELLCRIAEVLHVTVDDLLKKAG